MSIEQLEQWGKLSLLFVLVAAVLAVITLIVYIVKLSTNRHDNAVKFMYMSVAFCLFLSVLSSFIPIALDIYSGNAAEVFGSVSQIVGG